jgi:hypothetical protein
MITVDVNLSSIIPKYKPRYAILRNATRRQIIEFARSHPNVFIFPFVTVPRDKIATDLPDYRWLSRKGDSVRHYIAQPFYVGNLTPMESAICQLVEIALGQPLSECEEVLQ